MLSELRVLVVNPFGIGDVIFSFPLIEAVKALRPDAQVDYLCNERTRGLVAMNPSVRAVHEFSRDHFRKLLREDKGAFLSEASALWRAVRSARYDVVFDLSLGREYAFCLMLCGIRRRIGFDYKRRGLFLTDRVPLAGYGGKPVRQTVMELVQKWSPDAAPHSDYPRMGLSKERWQTWSSARGIRPGDFVAMVAPGGGKSWGADAHYKQWAPERFARAAARLVREKNARIVLVGDGGEKQLCDKVRHVAGLPGIEVMAGEDLGLVAAAMASANLFLGNDGGLLHLADLMGAPVVGIYGPVDETVYGPRRRPASAAVVQNVPCRPCYKAFRFPPCPHGKRCLEELGEDDVFAAIENVLSSVRKI